MGSDEYGEDVYAPLSSVLPMVDPNDIVVDGWDISALNLADAMERARVLEPALQQQLKSYMVNQKPRASIYDPTFIAANQVETKSIYFYIQEVYQGMYEIL